jgi:hypothetical protein
LPQNFEHNHRHELNAHRGLLLPSSASQLSLSPRSTPSPCAQHLLQNAPPPILPRQSMSISNSVSFIFQVYRKMFLFPFFADSYAPPPFLSTYSLQTMPGNAEAWLLQHHRFFDLVPNQQLICYILQQSRSEIAFSVPSFQSGSTQTWPTVRAGSTSQASTSLIQSCWSSRPWSSRPAHAVSHGLTKTGNGEGRGNKEQDTHEVTEVGRCKEIGQTRLAVGVVGDSADGVGDLGVHDVEVACAWK